MENKELTGRIIGAAITVHKSLGPGFLEEVYESALAIEFNHLSIDFLSS
jgi:GxxExxY protein